MQIIINIYMNMELQLHSVCSHTFISLQQSIHCIQLLTKHVSTDYYLDKYSSLTYPYYRKIQYHKRIIYFSARGTLLITNRPS